MRAFLPTGLILAGGVIFLFSGVAWAQTDSSFVFSTDVKITEAEAEVYGSFDFFSHRFTAFRGDTVYVIWLETRSSTPPIGTWIFFARSNDCGHTFGPNVVAAAGLDPSMWVDSAGIIYLAYQNGGDIFFRKSTNGGASFSARVRVTDDSAVLATATPAIAADNKGGIFVTWVDYRTDPYSAFSSASYDGGLTFTPNVQVNEPGTRGGPGGIAADDSGKVYVAYNGTSGGQSGIVVARSGDSGQSFNFHILVSDTPWSAGNLSMAISSGGWVGIAWTGSRVLNGFLNSILHFSVSFDRGQSFSPSVRVDDDSDLSLSTAPRTPSLVYRNGIFYVAWMRTDSPFGVNKIFFSFSQDSGQSFVPSVDVNANTTAPTPWPRMPGLAVNEEGTAFVAWVDGRYVTEIGDTWLVFGSFGRFSHLYKGDLNLDDLLTAADVVLELNAVFLGQTFPAPFESGDSNCDGNLSPADVVLLLNVVFLSGVFPCS